MTKRSSSQQLNDDSSRKVAKTTTKQTVDDTKEGPEQEFILSLEHLVLGDAQAVIWKGIHEFLHWTDALKLGATCQAAKTLLDQHQDVILKPLLDCLDSLVGSNKHHYYACGKIYAPISKRECTCVLQGLPSYIHFHSAENQPLASEDPRFQADYDEWSTHKKCAAMVSFIGTAVSNLRQSLRLDLNDACDPNKALGEIEKIESWRWMSWGSGWNRDKALAGICLYPRRAALAFNLAVILDAKSTLCSGAGNGCRTIIEGFLGDVDPCGSYFSARASKLVPLVLGGLVPFCDETLEEFIVDALPPPKQCELLGEALTQRLLLTAPMLESWMGYDHHNEKRVILPRRLERFDRQELEDEAMKGWTYLVGRLRQS